MQHAIIIQSALYHRSNGSYNTEVMDTRAIRTIITTAAAETERLGEAIGRRVHGGEVIELVSDLGGGKTTFVRGLARGMGSGDRVSSPTFTISQEYKTAKHTLVHFDFYRLDEPGLMAAELAESIADPKAVVVVEWGDIVADVLPTERVTITLKATSKDDRECTIAYPSPLSYLLPPSPAS